MIMLVNSAKWQLSIKTVLVVMVTFLVLALMTLHLDDWRTNHLHRNVPHTSHYLWSSVDGPERVINETMGDFKIYSSVIGSSIHTKHLHQKHYSSNNSSDRPISTLQSAAAGYSDQTLANSLQSTGWDSIQRCRQEMINQTCSKIGHQHMTLAEAGQGDLFRESVVVDRKHRAVYCAIPKAACSSWRSALAVLTDRVNSSVPISSLDVHNMAFMFSIGIKPLMHYSSQDRKWILKHYKKFLVVRHPFERLVSAFRDKFQTYNKWTRYFQLKFGRYIIKRYRKNPSELSLKTGHDVTFPEFITWILDQSVDEEFKFNPHWAKYEDLCQPCVIKYDYIVNFDTFDSDTKEVLQRLFNVNDTEKFFPHRNVKKTKSKDIEMKYFRLISAQDMQALYQLYKQDFTMFGYKWPF